MPHKDKAARAAYNREYRKNNPKSPEKVSFFSAKYRCTNPNITSYKYYGGRGIEFRFENFDEFLAHIGPKPEPDYDLDRIDNNGHYEPGNVRWVTHRDNCRNRRDTLLFTHEGKTQCLMAWCDELNLNYWQVQQRIYVGQTFIEAIQ